MDSKSNAKLHRYYNLSSITTVGQPMQIITLIKIP